ncbi:hypothetical protein WJX84_003899, partial [Apatococcus fuscideae]
MTSYPAEEPHQVVKQGRNLPPAQPAQLPRQ